MTYRIIFYFVLLLCLATIAVFTYRAVSPATAPAPQEKVNTSESYKNASVQNIAHGIIYENNPLLKATDEDFTLGNRDAKVTIFEYSSLSCPHCHDFHKNILPKLKANYIDSGKVFYVYRNTPNSRSALAGSKLAVCAGKENFFRMIDTLFETQSSWAYDDKYMSSLENIGRLAGITPEQFKKCQQDKKLEDSILRVSVDAANQLSLKAVPTFYINGEELSGDRPYTFFQSVIDKKLIETTKQGN